jgi:hypothetical protein
MDTTGHIHRLGRLSPCSHYLGRSTDGLHLRPKECRCIDWAILVGLLTDTPRSWLAKRILSSD